MYSLIITGSPTDWSNLSTALNVTKKMLDYVTEGGKAIVSLDLQLYAKCIHLQEKNKTMEGFIFRMAELHVVFTVLKVLGKNINNSGLDLSFEEAGIYGPATLCQIKEEKPLYPSLEASAFCSISHIISEIHENVRETLRHSSTFERSN